MRVYKMPVIVLSLVVMLNACGTNKSAKQTPEKNGQEYNSYGETPLIEAIKNQDNQAILRLLNSDRADIQRPDQDGVPPVLAAIKAGIDLDVLEAILQKTPLPPADILDRRNKNAYDYVRDFRANNQSYLRLLDKYQELKG